MFICKINLQNWFLQILVMNFDTEITLADYSLRSKI